MTFSQLLDIEGELVPVPEGDTEDWTFVGTPDSVSALLPSIFWWHCRLVSSLGNSPIKWSICSPSDIQRPEGPRHNLAQGRAPGQGPAAPPRVAIPMNHRRPEKGATIRTRLVLHPFRVPFRWWPVTQGAAPGFALHFALAYFILPFQGSQEEAATAPPGAHHVSPLRGLSAD